ncbi:phosphate ABC transporter permease subunit PstC [Bullifex porci]|uniref:Phosphate transport system permease protein n=2 Tax=Bullifex porci TaxID=2606638 RepID=A0A7X2PCX6_9SPIO|nr:phosphate ABC transporter permease subunit PstC [Bullifex porci]MDD7254535.1 phosphate ABC transporter permease subunit PstC [Bullifex porci]MDY2741142.1 phosphate ABC transporter permease subunit PstC [Bullifex porci]MSU06630.1 phosphate ABC transporter permease subunit PstC [Bullifex porci]
MKERAIGIIFTLLGLVSVLFVLLITVYLIVSGVPAIGEIGFINFMFGKVWRSTGSDPQFGILPFILTTIWGTIGSLIIGLPIGFFSAVYLAKMAPKRIRDIFVVIIGVISGVPSVVYGLVGMLVLVPFVRTVFNLPDGASLFASIIVLAVMILPTVIKVSLTSLEAVPKDYEEASLALGATKIETYFRVSVPAARSGILTSVVLGIGRAIGEAMAVMMVAGNVANMPSIFKSVRYLTTAVAIEMSYSSGLQRQALFSIALVLFCFIMIINGILMVLRRENKDA